MSISEEYHRQETRHQESQKRKEHGQEAAMNQAEKQEFKQEYFQNHDCYGHSASMIRSKPVSPPISGLALRSDSYLNSKSRRDEWLRAASVTPTSPSPPLEPREYGRGDSSAIQGSSEAFGSGGPSLKSSTTASFDAQNSGLPPTPPTVENSDEPPRDDSLSSNPQFADAVRNALRSEKSGVSTPTGRLLAPQTPGPSPPSRDERSVESFISESHKEQALLRPQLVHSEFGSHNESFYTARTDATSSSLRVMPVELSAPADIIPDSTKTFHLPTDRRQLNGQRRNWSTGQPLRAAPIKTANGELHHPLGGSRPRPTDISQSDVQQRSQSYPAGLQHDIDQPTNRLSGKRVGEQRLAKAAEVYNLRYERDNQLQISAEDVNNLVYQQIRAENAHRHSAVMNGGAMPVGVIFPPAEKEKTLKRTTKCQSLRESTDEEVHASAQSPRLHHNKAEPALNAVSNQQPVRNHRTRIPAPSANASAITIPKVRQRVDRTNDQLNRQHTLRRSRGEKQLRRPDTSDGIPQNKDLPLRSLSEAQPESQITQRTLRHFSHGAKLENNTHVRRTSLEVPHSPRKSFDARHLQPSTTPMSHSQLSDRTEVEVCEARGVAIFPHNNKSVLVVDSGSRPSSKHTETSSPASATSSPKATFDRKSKPEFTALVTEPQTPPRKQIDAKFNDDSPLVNPRAAPEPPAFRVIPPTPNDELDSLYDPADNSRTDARPQRRKSLLQKARRYSESFVQPLFTRSNSLRKQIRRMSISGDERPTNLSPMWKPRGFWDGIDSDEEYIDDYEPEPYPPRHIENGLGTETSTFPRNMSVRMPGFRGTGGFHLGNSLGLDRHGSNNRRHVVRMRTSEELLRRAAARRRRFSLPGSGLGASLTAMRAAGVHGIRDRLMDFKIQKEEKQREKRREILRSQIQHAR